MNTKLYRQGDVLVIPVSTIPTDTLKQTKRVTLALGEVTGHHHSIDVMEAVGYGTSEDGLASYFEASSDVELTHQEHDTITIPPGKYRSVRQSEYSPSAIRNVAD